MGEERVEGWRRSLEHGGTLEKPVYRLRYGASRFSRVHVGAVIVRGVRRAERAELGVRSQLFVSLREKTRLELGCCSVPTDRKSVV